VGLSRTAQIANTTNNSFYEYMHGLLFTDTVQLASWSTKCKLLIPYISVVHKIHIVDQSSPNFFSIIEGTEVDNAVFC